MPQRVLSNGIGQNPSKSGRRALSLVPAASARPRGWTDLLAGRSRRRAVVVLWALKHFSARTHPHQPRWHDTDVLAPYEPSVTVAVLAFGSSRPFSIGTRSVNWAKIAS